LRKKNSRTIGVYVNKVGLVHNLEVRKSSQQDLSLISSPFGGRSPFTKQPNTVAVEEFYEQIIMTVFFLLNLELKVVPARMASQTWLRMTVIGVAVVLFNGQHTVTIKFDGRVSLTRGRDKYM
jgi:hypothetical protein